MVSHTSHLDSGNVSRGISVPICGKQRRWGSPQEQELLSIYKNTASVKLSSSLLVNTLCPALCPIPLRYSGGQNHHRSWSLPIPNPVPAVLGLRKTPENITQVISSTDNRSADSERHEWCSRPLSDGSHTDWRR